MDALNAIAIAMAAILFTWVGYFLGIFFPAFGKSKRNKDERKAAGQSLIDLKSLGKGFSRTRKKVEISPISKTWRKSIDWLLEREPNEDEAFLEEGEDAAEESPGQTLAEVPSPREVEAQAVYLPSAIQIPEDAVFLWHDRQNKKLFAKVGKDVVDLDEDLSKVQHGALSMLLVDLQDRVGLSATLRAAISEGTEQVYAEKEKQGKIPAPPAEEALKKPSFNPVKSFLDYVKSDVPKLEEKPESIPSQINGILQEMLAGTPLDEKGISVTEWPQRGVVFIVGLQVYDAIDEIPDESIRQMIQRAVKQWEESQAEDS